MLRAEERIGPYTLIRQLGKGSFGVVWLAERRGKFLTTQVALKIPIDDEPDLDAIRNEAQSWLQVIGHPNVLPVLDADEYDGHIVIVSEYAPDGSLSDWLKRHGGKAPTVRAAVDMACGTLFGLEHLHGRRMIHRDLKPGNVLLQGETPRLTDFGVSRVLQSTGSTRVAGTPAYMAPEMFDGLFSEQTDVWAVGVMLYKMLAGNLPFFQQGWGALYAAIKEDEPAPLPEAVPAGICAIIARALTKDPAQRYTSARAMRLALIDAAAQLSPADHASYANTEATTILETPPAGSASRSPSPPNSGSVKQPGTAQPGSGSVPRLGSDSGSQLASSGSGSSLHGAAVTASGEGSPRPPQVPPISMERASASGFDLPVSGSHSFDLPSMQPADVPQLPPMPPVSGPKLPPLEPRAPQGSSASTRPKPPDPEPPSSRVQGSARWLSEPIPPPLVPEPPSIPSMTNVPPSEASPRFSFWPFLKHPPPMRDHDPDGAEMVWVSAGEFAMGDGDQIDNPRRRIVLEGFWIYRNPVTVAMYRRFCAAAKQAMPDPPPWGWIDDHPMVNVHWQDAVEYCKWARVSLPTEVQWEKAARGVDGRRFPWGNNWDPNRCRCSHSNYADAGSTVLVGAFPMGTSPYGVMDMAGNVWEWCHESIEGGSLREPGSGPRHVLRGGSWEGNLPAEFRTSFRQRQFPSYMYYTIGFRCVLNGEAP